MNHKWSMMRVWTELIWLMLRRCTMLPNSTHIMLQRYTLLPNSTYIMLRRYSMLPNSTHIMLRRYTLLPNSTSCYDAIHCCLTVHT